ncbi:MAG: hypothetical protein ABEJ98_00460 [Candidatus Nanohaloarchaea archaeon]
MESPLLRVASGHLSLFLVFYISGQVMGMAVLGEQLLGVDYALLSLVSMAAVLLYVLFGGMDASVRTDYFQGVMMSVIAVVVFGAVVLEFGGGLLESQQRIVSSLHSVSPGLAGTFHPGSMMFGGPVNVLAISWLLFAFILMPHLMNRLLALESEEDLRGFLMGAGLSLFTMSVFMVWAGLAGRVLFPGLPAPDYVVPRFLEYAFPAWISMVLSLGILSAILSTADSILQSVSAIIGYDIYLFGYRSMYRGDVETADIRNGELSGSVERRTRLVTRLGMVAVAAVSVAIAFLRPEGILVLTQMGITGLLSGIAIPVIASYLRPDFSSRTYEVGFFSGVTTYLVLFAGGLMENFFLVFLVAGAANLAAVSFHHLVWERVYP